MGKIKFLFEQKDKAPQEFEMEEGESILDIALDNDIVL